MRNPVQNTSHRTLAELDAADPLADFRQRFFFGDEALTYLDGNSLGRLPLATVALLNDAVQRQWGDRLIRSWNEGWFTLPERVGGKIARLVGAQSDEVIVGDSTSVNLFKLATAALQARPNRSRILTDDLNFPSDIYVLQGIVDLLGGRHRLEIIPSPDGVHGPVESIKEALDEDVALVTLSHTVFKSAYTYDMADLTAAAHQAGALTLWDLSHSAGAVPVELDVSQADLAVGCSYKYLNGGPGAPAYLYVRAELQEGLANPISGWMGQRDLFAFGLRYQPGAGLRRFLSGTPPVLSIAAIEPGVDLLLEAGIERLRAKSVAQTEYLVQLWREMLAPLGYSLNSPIDPAVRGSHVSLGHAEGLRIDQALIHEMGVLPDFRQPDNIRLGIAPIYTRFSDIFAGATALRRIVEGRLYERYQTHAPTVT
jgi:kynureninase